MTAPVAVTAAAIREAAATLKAGGLVAFPTETVYGLGANADDAGAVRAIFRAKGRPADHPLIVHLADTTRIDLWCRRMPRSASLLAEAFWPGALTLIVPRSPRVLDVVTGGQDSVGLRVPSHPVAQQLLRGFRELGGEGVAAPSANRFGHVSPTRAAHVVADLGEGVAMVLDGGGCEVGIESTIVAFRDEDAMLLRPGGIAQSRIEDVLRGRLIAPAHDAPRASGTLASHYATRTRALLVEPDRLAAETLRRDERDESVAVLARSMQPRDFDGAWIVAPSDATGYAHALYANLRDLDAAGADEILIELPPDTPAWRAVHDRLARATFGNDDDRD